MDFCTVGLDELPDMVCPNCHIGIDARPNGYETTHWVQGSAWEVECSNCGHTFHAIPNMEIRWRAVAEASNVEC